ncbi:MAG: hypothetical protein ACE5EL_06645 [Anaerolineae bacterium]
MPTDLILGPRQPPVAAPGARCASTGPRPRGRRHLALDPSSRRRPGLEYRSPVVETICRADELLEVLGPAQAGYGGGLP